MSVQIQPSGTLGFHRPLTQLVKRTLTVSNPNSQPVAFKVKTTAPKQYCVRPNSGRIEPGELVEVQVLLQPMQADPEPDAKCRDKFLVQSAIIAPEHDLRPITELWSLIDKDDKDSISEHKIRCAYLPPLEGNADTSSRSVNHSLSASRLSTSLNGLNTPAGSAASAAEPLDNLGGSQAKSQATPISEGAAVTPPLDSTKEGHPRSGSDQTSPFKSAIAAPVAAVATAASAAGSALGLSPGQPSNESRLDAATAPKTNGAASASFDGTKLQADLSEARREIERLKIQLAEAQSGLRQRQVPAPLPETPSPLKSAGDQVVHGGAGVPLQTVLIAVGVTFVFTWLFF